MSRCILPGLMSERSPERMYINPVESLLPTCDRADVSRCDQGPHCEREKTTDTEYWYHGKRNPRNTEHVTERLLVS